MLYSTCTVAREENNDNVSWIKETLPFVPVSIEEDLPESLRGKTGKEDICKCCREMDRMVSLWRNFSEKEYDKVIRKEGVDRCRKWILKA